MERKQLLFKPCYKDGKLKMCFTQKGELTKYLTFSKCTTPPAECWDNKTHTYNKNLSYLDMLDASKANEALKVWNKEIQTFLETLQANDIYPTPGEFLDHYKKGLNIKASTVETLGVFVKQFIENKKNNNLRLHTATYQNYITLLHKLEYMRDNANYRNIIDMPLKDITVKEMIIFENYILECLNAKNHIRLMKNFKAVMNVAKEQQKNNYNFDYNFMERHPRKSFDIKEKQIKALTVEEYNKFMNFDITTFKNRGVNRGELYHDFCILLYETMSRPADVFKMKYTNIVSNKDKLYITYRPEKFKNTFNNNLTVYTPLTEKAKEIINKYKGVSRYGYILPFTFSDWDCDFNNIKDAEKWCNKHKRGLEQVNTWLKKISECINIKMSKDMTTYVFRHSAITHDLAKGTSPLIVAKKAGTSIQIIEQHYLDSTQLY